MRTIRLYINTPLTRDSECIIADDRFHYLTTVLRAKPGSPLVLFDGRGGEYSGDLIAVEKKRAIVRIGTVKTVDDVSPLAVTLALGISRGERMTYAIQKAVELGVAAIQPLFTAFCEVKLDEERAEKRQQHWQGIVIAAAEQSGRTTIPQIAAPLPLKDWTAAASAEFDHPLVLHPGGERTLRQLAIRPPATVAILIGPEGGLSDDEVDLARHAQFTSISLGRRILRTETAAAATLAALQALYGDI